MKKWILAGMLACVLTTCMACDGWDIEEPSQSQSSSTASSENISSIEENSSEGESLGSSEESVDSDESVNSDNSDNSASDDSTSSGSASDDSTSSSDDGEEPEISRYTVKFDTDGGSLVDSQQVEKGEKVSKPEDPKKSSSEGEYEFLGWYYGNVQWDFDSDVVTQDITLTAKWKKTDSYTNPFLPKD